MSVYHDNDDGGGDHLYQTAVDALFSSVHQATTKQEIQLSSRRRTLTVQDMRYYWSIITKDECQDETSCTHLPPMIHVTGTKGKGSTACMCEVVLRHAHKLRTGLFTSPHLLDIRERIRIDGRPVHRHVFGRVYWKIRRRLEEAGAAGATTDDDNQQQMEFVVHDNHDEEDLGPPPVLPGYFRMLTLMALYVFSYELRSHIDVMIIEVGMGGRYDATNFIDVVEIPASDAEDQHDQDDKNAAPARSFIDDVPRTPICICGVTLLDYDHVRVLGDTLGKIAWEKGGIFATTKNIQSSNNNENISPRPMSNDTTESASEGINHTSSTRSVVSRSTPNQRRRIFYILDSNGEEVLTVMRSCAQIEGRNGVLTTADATGTRLRDALKALELQLGLAGDHQYGNATLAVTLCQTVVHEMMKNPTLAMSTNTFLKQTMGREMYSSSILQALSLAEWPARCQTYRPVDDDVYSRFIFYLDGAHTPQSLKATVDWFNGKIAQVRGKNDENGQTKPQLVFNCSHERNPIELLELLSSSNTPNTSFDHVYFTKSDSVRPSAISPPSPAELLDQRGIPIQDDLCSTLPPGISSWQDTLACLWRHIEPTSSHVHCNMNAAQVLDDLISYAKIKSPKDGTHERIPVFVTGSLYLVGSFLDALGWSEESSAVVSAKSEAGPLTDNRMDVYNDTDFLDVDDFNQGPDAAADSCTARGARDGRTASEAASFFEGQMLGASKGLEIGLEIGFAKGLLEVCRKRIDTLTKKDDNIEGDVTETSTSAKTSSRARLERSIDELERAIQDFPSSAELFAASLSNNLHRNESETQTSLQNEAGDVQGAEVDVQAKLQRIRARCKVLTVQLGIPYHSLKRVMDDALREGGTVTGKDERETAATASRTERSSDEW